MNNDSNRFSSLDGWRGLSILFVLAAHLLPLGPKSWKLNAFSGVLGMALFFCLSGFLIARFFLESSSVKVFFVRRMARILPLAWLGLLVAWLFYGLPTASLPYNLLFLANWPPMHLEDVTGHYWSLCVEVQYYIAVGLLFYVFRKNYVYFVILACVGVTAYRIFNGVPVAVNTYYRVDEILAGSLLLFAVSGRYAGVVQKFLLRLNPLLPLFLLLASSHEAGSWLQYFRPYFAALLVGSTVYKQSGFWFDFLKWRALAYLAVISYALYVIHPFLVHTWLGEGETLTKYLKRPLLFAVLLLLAHSSTFYFEKFFMSYARRWSKERTGA